MNQCHEEESEVGMGPSHVKVSVGVSLLVSAAAALVAWGVTWGVTSQRLAATVALLANARGDLNGQVSLNNAQEAKIAVLGSQYAEIIRRLDAIDRKLE